MSKQTTGPGGEENRMGGDFDDQNGGCVLFIFSCGVR